MSVRNQKIEARIMRLAAEAFARGTADPRLTGLISVTRVQITPDHRDAKVFVSVMSARPDQTIQQGLNSAQKRLQSFVARGLTMKFAPRLTFHLDNSLKKQAQVLATIATVQESVPNPAVPQDQNAPSPANPPSSESTESAFSPTGRPVTAASRAATGRRKNKSKGSHE